MHTELYCPDLERVSRVDMVRAIHQAHLQLTALRRYVDLGRFDVVPALSATAAVLRDAGHPGFNA